MKKNILSNPRPASLASLAAGLAAASLMLSGNETQAQPTISGIVLPNAPNNQNGFTVGELQFQGAVPPNANQLSFQVSSATGVTVLTVQLTATTLPGVVTTTTLTPTFGLSVSGPNTGETVTAPLANDTVYSAVISSTDAGGTSSTTVKFDTLNPNYFTFEAEDFDYGGGQYFDSLPPGTFPSIDAYANLAATVGIDCNNHSGGTNSYRPNPLETEGEGDTARIQYSSSGYPDFDIGFNNGGDWGNYTRHYPPGVYNIYLRGSGGNGPKANACEIGLLTSGYATTNQTTETLGQFSVLGLGWQTYTWCPAIDANGNLVAWGAAGDQETLRFTVTGGNCNENCYLLVPAVPVITPNSTNLFQGNTATLSVAPYALSTLAVQWQTDNGSGGATWSSISGATNASYTVTASSLSAEPYEYQVVFTLASNSVPVNVTSGTVTLNILAPTKPVVVEDTYPASATAIVGTSTSFTASFSGPQPISYQWLVSSNLGVTFTPIAGQTNTTLVVPNLSVFTNEYELEASNAQGATFTTPATLTTTPAPTPPPVQLAGDLVAELRSSDLVTGATIWTNRAGSAASVGNFQRLAGALQVSNNVLNPGTPLWGAYPVNSVYVTSSGTALQSALAAPAEISASGASSGEAWIYATATSGNSSVIAYGVQGGSGAPEEDREMNWGSGSGCFSGDFGSLDCGWQSPYPETGAWFYLAWTWDGTNAIGYVNGVQNVYHTLSPSANFNGYPIETVDTVVGLGAALNSGPNIAVDNFNGWIASARLSSGVLTPAQISNNFAAGLLAEVPVTVYPPIVSPTNEVTVGTTVTLTGEFATNSSLAYTYQWQWDGGSGGMIWTAIAGATNLIYSLDTTGLTPGYYEYELVLSNSADSVVAVSSPITIQVTLATAPMIVQDTTPSFATIYVTAITNLTAVFSGGAPLDVQWQVSSDGTNFSAITSQTSTNLIISSDVPFTNYYRLYASNPFGTNTSTPAEVIVLPAPPLPVPGVLQTAGDVIVNLQATDLSPGASVWNNATINSNSVGSFSPPGGGALKVTNTAPYLYHVINSVFVHQNISNAVQSTLAAPVEIVQNNPVSVEAWIFATAINEQNSCVVGYGLQGQSEAPQEDREFTYEAGFGSGSTSGDFGNFDSGWATTPTTNTWHYLAWAWDGTTVTCYMDGNYDHAQTPGSPLITADTVIGIGGGLGQEGSGSNITVDPFQGYIAAARVESGVLNSDQVTSNYNAGLFGIVPASIYPPPIQYSFSGGLVTLTFGTNAALLQATNLLGPWTTNAIATSPYVLNPRSGATTEFFKLLYNQ